ncbi:hypothetical protein F5Y16DRAFT_381921 [Xylariaceae sp. FL0255]|nr:hypothetical protein F5Y16DRAFT_381921 [Xylariaceae sp. FL0255]
MEGTYDKSAPRAILLSLIGSPPPQVVIAEYIYVRIIQFYVTGSMSRKLPALLSLLVYFVKSDAIVIEDPGARRITPSPVLTARGAFQTAGYISGDPNSPLTCPGTSSVSKGPLFAFGCCGGAECFKPSTCYTNGQPPCGENCVYTQFVSCTNEASPSCAEYILKTAIDDINPYTSWACMPEATKAIALVSTTSADDSGGDSGTTTSTSTGASPSNTSGFSTGSGDSNSSSGGLTEDQKIALGTGIGVGVAAIIVGLVAWRWPRRPR